MTVSRTPHRGAARASLARSAGGALAVAVALTTLSGGCDVEEFTPSSRIDKPRIIAVAAEPPVVGLGQRATLTALVVDADGRDSSTAPERALDFEIRWRACNPWAPVFQPDRDCVGDNALALTAVDGEDWQGQATVDIPAVLQAFPPPDYILDRVGGPPGSGDRAPAPGDDDANDEDGEDGEANDDDETFPDARETPCPHDYNFVELPIVAEVTVGERRVVAVQRVRVTWDDDDTSVDNDSSDTDVSRASPSIDGLVFGGTVATEADVVRFAAASVSRVTAVIDRERLDPVCLNNDADQIADEPLTYLAYTTAGDFDEPEAVIEYAVDGTESARTLSWAAPDRGAAVMWLVAVDSDGGVGWGRFALQAE
ncbi:MAG: hypothetical protein Tsb0020_45600 [Haliangiales bacterium]